MRAHDTEHKERKGRIVATIEARMNSTRLPGKVLLQVQERPLLGYLVESLKAVKQIDAIVLATTDNNADNVLEDFARAHDILCFRGDEEDVLGRVIGAADMAAADVVVEVTGDCPLLDPRVISQIISTYIVNDVEYVSNTHFRSYPDGMDVQVISVEALKRSAEMTTCTLDREHVTLHIRNNPEIFRQMHVVGPDELYWPDLGLTLDEEADYRLISELISRLSRSGKELSCGEIISLIRQDPALYLLNHSVLRRGDT